MTQDDTRFTPDQRIFLSQAYSLKAIADYETGLGSEISVEKATAALEAARKFVDAARHVLTTPEPP